MTDYVIFVDKVAPGLFLHKKHNIYPVIYLYSVQTIGFALSMK